MVRPGKKSDRECLSLDGKGMMMQQMAASEVRVIQSLQARVGDLRLVGQTYSGHLQLKTREPKADNHDNMSSVSRATSESITLR